MKCFLERDRQQVPDGLTPFAQVCFGAAQAQGVRVGYCDGMTLGDLEIITGLPASEIQKRLKALKGGDTGGLSKVEYVEKYLSQGTVKEYPAMPAPKEKPPALSTELPKAEIIQLAFWGEDYRAAPNAVFRSALFPALHPTQKQTRRYLEEEEIFSVSGIKVLYTGKQLDQSDLDVYLELLHMAQPYPLGTPIKFSAHAILKALGLPTGGSNHDRLHKVLVRLCAGVVEITDHGKRYFGQLLHGGIRDEVTMNYTIKINPEFAVLFGVGMWGKIDLKTRRVFGRKDVAKVLHAYYSTHVSPGFHDLETLYNLTGLKGINRKRDILKAHDALKAVGFCEGYEISENKNGIRLLNMNQHPSQTRALAKQAKKEARL